MKATTRSQTTSAIKAGAILARTSASLSPRSFIHGLAKSAGEYQTAPITNFTAAATRIAHQFSGIDRMFQPSHFPRQGHRESAAAQSPLVTRSRSARLAHHNLGSPDGAPRNPEIGAALQ